MLQKKQVIYRVRKNKIYPLRLAKNKQNLDILEQMIELLSNSIGLTRGKIEESLQYFAKQIWQPKLSQAVIKLLLDKAIFDENKNEDFIQVREKIFENSKNFWFNLEKKPQLEEIVPQILKSTFQKTPQFSDNFLYKDLPTNQLLKKFIEITPEDFIDWFDLLYGKSNFTTSSFSNYYSLFYKKEFEDFYELFKIFWVALYNQRRRKKFTIIY